MDELKPDINTPDFSSITGIMERFKNVPYEQFQAELDLWFKKSLADQGMDASQLQHFGLPNLSSLPDLVSQIYHQAEVLNVLSNSKINTENEGI